MRAIAVIKSESARRRRPSTLPRLGFAGTGWIGLHRMQAVQDSGLAEIVAIGEPDPACAASAQAVAAQADVFRDFEQLLECELEGIVIATPSALHAAQAQAALARRIPVFCQKPLSRTAAEAASVVRAARAADRLLAVDLSYRHVAGVSRMREMVQGGQIGDVFAVDATFHNAYGPDKPWFRDVRLSGGGCVIDLGTHLIDLLSWILDFPVWGGVQSRLYSCGRLLDHLSRGVVEDYAVASWVYANRIDARVACSWNLSAGQDCVIEVNVHGSRGSLALYNVGGSFFDFVVEHRQGTSRDRIAGPPDAWGGRAIIEWVEQLSLSRRFDPQAERLVDVARLVDAIYHR
ncbi:MAG TPA: Gfo/Idh/MocA family oxidoreductase [Candidatus Limnocylindrales bacterium]|nr:Gfo/Idh/MocA family oxidoreductase [Candidatus Limnocylindrales bacterium]